MAVVAFTVAEFAVHARLSADATTNPPEPLLSLLTGILDACKAVIEDYAGDDTPQSVLAEATGRMGQYLYEATRLHPPACLRLSTFRGAVAIEPLVLASNGYGELMFNPFRRRASETRASYANAALTAALDRRDGQDRGQRRRPGGGRIVYIADCGPVPCRPRSGPPRSARTASPDGAGPAEARQQRLGAGRG